MLSLRSPQVSKENILDIFTVDKECTFWTNRKEVDALCKLLREEHCFLLCVLS